MVAAHLAQEGLATELKFFSSVQETGSHRRSLSWVLQGRADGAAIDSHLMDHWRRTEPEIDHHTKVVKQLGPSPSQPVVARAELGAALIDDLRETVASVTAEDVPSLAEIGLERFVVAHSRDYNPVREMVALSRRA